MQNMLQGSKKSGNLKSDGLEFGDGTEHGKYRCAKIQTFLKIILSPAAKIGKPFKTKLAYQ